MKTKSKYTQKELANLLDCAPVTIYRFAQKAGIMHNARDGYTLAEALMITHALSKGARSKKIRMHAAGFFETLGGNKQGMLREEAKSEVKKEENGVLLELLEAFEKRLAKLEGLVKSLDKDVAEMDLELSAVKNAEPSKPSTSTEGEDFLREIIRALLKREA